MRTRGIILVIIVLLITAAVFAWKLFNPGPTAFAGGSTVSLADYHAADPTGVPDLEVAHFVRVVSDLHVVLLQLGVHPDLAPVRLDGGLARRSDA